MKFLKKSAFLLVFIAVITAALCLYGCKKSSASDEENGIIMVSKDVFEEKISVVGGKLSPFSIEELKQYDIPYIADGESYYLLLHLTDADMYGFSIFVNGATLFNESELYALGTGYKDGEIELRPIKSDYYDYVSREEAYAQYPDDLYGMLYVDINEERKDSDYYVAARIDGGKVITEEIKIEVEIFLRKQQGDKVVLTVNKQPSHAKHVGAEATVKYLTSSDYTAGSIDTKLKDTLTMSTGERYYAVIDYVLSSPVAVEKNDTGNIRIDVYDPAAVDSGGLLVESYNFTFGVEEFPTAIFTKDGTGIDSSFTLPSESGESRRYRFIVSLSPVGAGSINLRARLYSDEITFVPDFKLEGSLSTGEVEEIERTFDYELSGDGSYYTVVGVGGEVGDSITVPSTHNGKPVKAIADDVFSTFKHLKEVKLTSGIEKNR